MQAPGDQFSFPSGHASRAFLLFVFALETGLNSYFHSLCLFAVFVAASRTVIGRHYISDVTAGICIGLLEGGLIRRFWIYQNDWLMLRSWMWSFFSL